MADLRKNVRLKETISVQDGVKEETKTTFTNIGCFVFLIVLGIGAWVVLAGIDMIYGIFTYVKNFSDFIAHIITGLIFCGLPSWFMVKLFKWTQKQQVEQTKEVPVYKTVPNPNYDEAFGHKMRTRIAHKYGDHVIHRYLDETFTVDNMDEFYHLRNFSFSGSALVTRTEGGYNGRNSGSALGTLAGGLLGVSQVRPSEMS